MFIGFKNVNPEAHFTQSTILFWNLSWVCDVSLTPNNLLQSEIKAKGARAMELVKPWYSKKRHKYAKTRAQVDC